MTTFIQNRRTFLGRGTGLAGAAAVGMPEMNLAAAMSMAAGSTAAAAKAGDLPVSKRVQDFITAANEAARRELKPTAAQLEHGMELHRNSIVCDLHGQVNTNHRVGMYSEPMKRRALRQLTREHDPARKKKLIASIRLQARKTRALELVRDRALQGDFAALWRAAGVTVGVEPVARADREVADLPHVVKQMARSLYVHDNVPWLERLNDLEGVNQLKSAAKHGVLFQCSKPDAYFAGPQVKDPLGALGLFYALGLRIAQLTNSNKNLVGCSHAQETDTGLTAAGRDVIRRMNELGMLVDLSHCGHRTALAAIETSTDPVVATHTACRGIHVGGKSKYRNITDEALQALAGKGGMVGIARVPNLLGDFGLETFFKHIDHVVNLVGVDHVGFGADNGGLLMAAEPPEFIAAFKPASFQPSGLKGTKRYWEYDHEPNSMSWTATPYITVGLVCRGYSDEDIRKIIGGNFLRMAGPVLGPYPQGSLV